MIRLLKPLEYYEQKYGTWKYGLNKLYLMMEKEHNRGQEGAGIASVKLDTEPGHEYMFREGMSYVHPFLRRNNWKAKNLCLCGNFNMTNIDEIFEKITKQGQCPRIYSDSYIMLEFMGHRLDREVERNFIAAQAMELENTDITRYIEDHVKMSNVLKTSMGEMFCMRDPWGIRPAFYYIDDEVAVLASERPVLQTTFDLSCDDVKELEPGTALLVKRNGQCSIERIIEQKSDSKCSFERIYFSRGNDRDIYKERKQLGEQLTEPVLRAINYDTEHTVFSFIPNTAEVAFYGMLDGFKRYVNEKKIDRIQEVISKNPTREELASILNEYVRTEKAWKDIKLRTFITEDSSRNDLASHVYDITYESLVSGVDHLVVIADSIVRGTTLKESIFRILDRLHPKKIVMVSSAPQIRYPDYYGIDMARLEEFCAFRAAIDLLKERGMHDLLDATYHHCLEELSKPKEEMQNYVRDIYKPFTVEEINKKIVEMLRPETVTTPIEVVFQSIEGLRNAIPGHRGDWYFTGHYPTYGGTKLCLRAFVNYIENHYQYEHKF